MRKVASKFVLSMAGALAFAIALATPAHAAKVAGTVKLDGDPPARLVIKMDADPKCVEIHGGKQVGTENAIVSKSTGVVANVFVWLKDGVTGKFAPPSEPAHLDQEGCMYTPHVVGMQTGQVLRIHNSDDTLHNINCQAENNPPFNQGMPGIGEKDKDTFKRQELPVKFKCDVHPWMGAFLFVVDHPYFSVTSIESKGAFEIKDVPDGDYTVAAWHETFGELEAKISVKGGDVTQDFTFKPAGN